MSRLSQLRYRLFGNAISLRERISDWRYDLLQRSANGMGVPCPDLFLTLEVFNAKGDRTYKLRRRSHSWNRNAYNFLFVNMCCKNVSDNTFAAGKLSMKDVDGNVIWSATSSVQRDHAFNYDIANASHGILAAAADDTLGIVIGTDDTAESFEDCALTALIDNGAGAGEMNYVASELHSMSYVGVVLKDTLERFFNNNSGGAITVNEIGIYVGYMKTGPAAEDFMIARDKLGAGVAVADTAQLKVTYEISLTYPV